MPDPVVIPGAAMIRLGWLFSGQGGFNILGASVTGTVTFNQALADAIGAGIKSAFTTNLAARLTGNTSLVRVGVRDIRQQSLPEFRDTGAAVSGTLPTVDSLPKQTALVVTLRTATAGKHGRGRVYVGGWSESDNDSNGNALAAASAAAVAFVQAVSSTLTANGLALALLQRPQTGRTITRTINAQPGMVRPVIRMEAIDNRWDTQRRRNNARGAIPTFLIEPVAFADL